MEYLVYTIFFRCHSNEHSHCQHFSPSLIITINTPCHSNSFCPSFFWLFFNQFITCSQDHWFDSNQEVSLHNDQFVVVVVVCCIMVATMLEQLICVFVCVLRLHTGTTVKILVLEYWQRISCIHTSFGTIHIHSTLLFAEQRYYESVLIHLCILSWFTHHAAFQSYILRFLDFTCLISLALKHQASELYFEWVLVTQKNLLWIFPK